MKTFLQPLTPSDALCRDVADRQGGVCLLAFSRGKDSIAAWIQLHRHFSRVIPFYLADVPGLGFVEQSLQHYERHFGAPIVRLVSPYFFNLVSSRTYVPPPFWDALDELELYRDLDGEDLDEYMRKRAGLPPDSLIAHGWRTADSLNRRQNMERTGAIDAQRGWFYPVHDWSHARVAEEIEREGCGLPVDYELFGRSFESIQWRYLAPLEKAFPDDYARILRLFPLATLDGFRRQLR